MRNGRFVGRLFHVGVFAFVSLFLVAHDAGHSVAHSQTLSGQSASASPNSIAIRGLIVSLSQTVVSAEISARVKKLDLREGDRFSAGDSLISFDCAYFDAELKTVRVKRNLAEKQVEQKQRLAKLKSIAKIEVAIAEARLEELDAKIELQQVITNRCDLRAPFDGRVVKKLVSTHQSVGAGTELLEIVGQTDLRLRAIIPSLWLTWLVPGSSFEIKVDETQTRFSGTVEKIGAAVDPGSQTVTVYGLLDGVTDRLIPGMSGTVTFAGVGE